MKSVRISVALFMTSLFLACTLSAAPALGDFKSPASSTSTLLAPGVMQYQFVYDDLYGGPQFVSIIQVNLNSPDLEIGIGVCDGKTRLPISKLAKQEGAIAAINFGYFGFNPAAPAGMLKKDGVFASESSVGQGSGGYFAHTGNKVAFYHEANLDKEKYQNMRAGFPVLVYDGKIYDKIGSYDHVLGRHNRTAIGLTASNILYFVVFDGRSKGNATGITCPDLAKFMQQIGCCYAMNMDGGGSTAMWTAASGIISYPSDNKTFDHLGERSVYDIFYVRYREVAEKAIAIEEVDEVEEITPAA